MNLAMIFFLAWFLFLYLTKEKQLSDAVSKEKFNRPAAITAFVRGDVKRSLWFALSFCILLLLIPIITNPKLIMDMVNQTIGNVDPSLAENAKVATTHNHADTSRVLMQVKAINFSTLQIFQFISIFVIFQFIVSAGISFTLGFKHLKEDGFMRLRLANYIGILLQKSTEENHAETYKKLEQFR